MATVVIERLTGLPPDGLSELLAASVQEGFWFVRRLVAGDDQFYRALGFQRSAEHDCTHVRELAGLT